MEVIDYSDILFPQHIKEKNSYNVMMDMLETYSKLAKRSNVPVVTATQKPNPNKQMRMF